VFQSTFKKFITRGGRKGTRVTRPVLISPGTSYSLAAQGVAGTTIHRRAEVHWDAKTEGSELRYYDGTGSVTVFAPLGARPYKLAFWYSVPQRGLFPMQGGPEMWLGAVLSEDVVIRLVER
jgi:hypothetical protein